MRGRKHGGKVTERMAKHKCGMYCKSSCEWAKNIMPQFRCATHTDSGTQKIPNRIRHHQNETQLTIWVVSAGRVAGIWDVVRRGQLQTIWTARSITLWPTHRPKPSQRTKETVTGFKHLDHHCTHGEFYWRQCLLCLYTWFKLQSVEHNKGISR